DRPSGSFRRRPGDSRRFGGGPGSHHHRVLGLPRFEQDRAPGGVDHGTGAVRRPGVQGDRRPAAHRSLGVVAVRVVRGIGGVMTGGLVVLALVVASAAVFAQAWAYPGPGVGTVSWHVAASVLAVGAQHLADRRGRVAATVAVTAIVLVTVLLLWW